MSMNPRIENGWVVVDCDAPDAAPVFIGVGKTADNMIPAYRDYSGGVRVAKIMTEVVRGKHPVHIKIGSVTTLAGVLVVV